MPIVTGSRLGPYEIVAAIGAAGMGEVYRARDTRLVWNRNGREIFFRTADGNRMMAVPITTQPALSVGTPKMLFEKSYRLLPALSTPNYDVAPDGQRFLMLRPTGQDQPLQINVVVNWVEELKQKVPSGQK